MKRHHYTYLELSDLHHAGLAHKGSDCRFALCEIKLMYTIVIQWAVCCGFLSLFWSKALCYGCCFVFVAPEAAINQS